MSAHTPGPWHVNAIANGRIVGDETAANFDKLQVSAGNVTVAAAYRRHDAALIAAAPKLLNALKELIDLVEADATFENSDIEPYKYDAIVDDVKRRARAAIAKAEGKS